MAFLARPVDPRLCQKVQCGVVSPDELTPDVLADCMTQGYGGTKSPLASECHQYYPSLCQSGPLRAFPDISDAWVDFGPNVADISALWSAMPAQAVGMPAPFEYASSDSGGVPIVPMHGVLQGDGSTLYVPDSQGSTPGPSNLFNTPVPGAAGYPYSPGANKTGDFSMTSDATPLDQMAGPTGPLKWPWTLAADYHTPAAPDVDYARYTTLPAGPSTFLRPLPSITPIHGRVSALDAYAIEDVAHCGFGRWVDGHKLAAVVGLAALYFVLKGGK